MKIGSAVLAPHGSVDPDALKRLSGDIARAQPGREFIIVSSGAVASGFRHLGLKSPPKTIVQKQASAAVGQQLLMAAWANAFAPHGRTVAQVLLTGDDLADRRRLQNARRTLEELLARNIVPIINENDSVSFAEIKVGDNDRLSALVASLLSADLLLVLSSVEGLYAKGTKRAVPLIATPQTALPHITSDTSSVGTGGMVTKVQAATIATDAGVPLVIAGGHVPDVINRVLTGEPLGTLFAAGQPRKSSRQRWLGHAARAQGIVSIDPGAAKALRERTASLLASGIVQVSGDFEAGSTVDICESGKPSAIARGIAAYGADEIRRIQGKRSSQIAATLGYCYTAEVVHRDNMVMLG